MRSDARLRNGRLNTALLLVGPAALLGGALAFEYIGGLAPCEMCMWQRWALVAALGLALLGWGAGHARALQWLAALAVLAGAGIAAFHVGVEQHWWQGITTCAAPATVGSTADVMGQIMAAPLVRCDAIAWSLFGVSMAGWNALISSAIGGLALWRLTRR
jgi:disulfide bond formation protein DsbB